MESSEEEQQQVLLKPIAPLPTIRLRELPDIKEESREDSNGDMLIDENSFEE